jgi:hypothetical protein
MHILTYKLFTNIMAPLHKLIDCLQSSRYKNSMFIMLQLCTTKSKCHSYVPQNQNVIVMYHKIKKCPSLLTMTSKYHTQTPHNKLFCIMGTTLIPCGYKCLKIPWNVQPNTVKLFRNRQLCFRLPSENKIQTALHVLECSSHRCCNPQEHTTQESQLLQSPPAGASSLQTATTKETHCSQVTQ